LKKTVPMGFPHGEGSDIAFFGESIIGRNNQVKVPREIVDKYGLEVGDKLTWLVKGDTLFIRFQTS
jgi:hypothetical protein